MIDRRAFLGSLAGSLLAAPLAAEAQQAAKIPRIGYLANRLAANPDQQEAFLQGLRDLGYVDGRNVVIEYQDAEGKLERLPALAARLLRSRSMSSWPPQVHCPRWPPNKRAEPFPLCSLRLAIR